MASRHPIPVLRLQDVGSDERNIIPRFPDPVVVEFSAGKALDDFVKQISASVATKIVAAAGAGKSVRMPTELYRAVGGVFVHCVPSRLLAVSLHDYIKSLNQPDVPVNLCLDVVDEYPTSGLVFTSSATFVGQACRWKSLGNEPSVMLYMDECHESDASTAVIRTLRQALPGVAKYAESSATPGTGDLSSTFAQARLPSSVTEIRCSMPPPAEWRMTEGKVPWSLKKLGGDIAVFSDDPKEAATIMRKFTEAGLKAYRLTGHTSPDEFRRVVSSLNVSGEGVVSVLVLDYTFRSGFSFPTIDRIIDMSNVGFYVNECGSTVQKFRQPFNAEVYQTKNRGGRFKGRSCDYFRMQFEPGNVLVHLEGAEAQIACVWYRMLGFQPDSLLDGTPLYAGNVPRNILAALSGNHVLSCYKFDTAWPGKPVERKVSSPVLPIVLDSPVYEVSPEPSPINGITLADFLKSPVVDVDTYSGSAGARPPSVFSLQDGAEEDGVLTEEAFVNAHRKSVRARSQKENAVGLGVGVPPVPPIPDGVFDAINTINNLKDSMRADSVTLRMGEYYRIYGFSGEIRTRYFPDGIRGVVNSAQNKPLGKFVDSLRADASLEAKQRALMDANRATVKYKALITVMEGVRKRSDKFRVLDSRAMDQWFEMARDMLMGADATVRDCFKVLERVGIGELETLDPKLFLEEELKYVGALMRVLHACIITSAGSAVVEYEPQGETDPYYLSEVLEQAEEYNHLVGRINMRISGKSFRERFANMLLRGKPVEVDAVLAS